MSDFYTDHTTAVGETVFLRGDLRVADGAHWRISIPSDAVPAGPVAVFRSELVPDPLDSSQPGVLHQNAEFDDVEPDRPLVLGVADPGPDWIIAWALVEAEGELRIAVIDPVAAPNGEYAEIAARTGPPYGFAVADMQMIRATGHGRVHGVELFRVPRTAAEGLGDLVEVATLAAEAADDIAEYARATHIEEPWATHAEEPWQERVARSAPSFGLPYDPRGPDRAVDHHDEIARIEALAWSEGGVAEWVAAAYRSLNDPVAATISRTGLDGATITYNTAAAMHTACVDPGIARWLGLSGTFPDLRERPDLGERQMFVAAVPVYRYMFGRPVVGSRPGDLGHLMDVGGLVAERYDQLTNGGLTRAVALARGITPGFRLGRWTVSLLVVPLPAVLDAPPVAPAAPRPVTSRATWDASWDASVEPPAKQRWTHTIALEGAVPTGSVSLVTAAPDWQTHHSPGDGTDQGEANRMIAGWPRPSLKARNPVVSAGLPVNPDPGVSDAVTFEVRLGDWVGRWSDPGTLNAGPPRRPAPPQPLVSAALVRAHPAPTGTAPASPGTVTADLRVPPTTAPGSHPTSTVTVTSSHGHSEVVNLTPAEGRAGARRRVTFAAPQTVPGQQFTVTVTARSADAAGTDSGLGRCEVPVSDARPVRAPTVAPRLLATTRRTNDATVSITLAITAQPGTAAYRFLMAAETLLWSGVPALPADPADVRALPRSVRAKEIIDAGAGERRHYMWATDEPAAVDAAGRASAPIDLPSGTSDVVFVKAVPMAGTPTGKPPEESVSTPFAEIPPAAVVVPISDVPPIARLRLTSPAPGRITASVTVSGADRRVLKRLDGPLQARIVEVVDPDTSDPVFWPPVFRPEVESIDLADEGDAFTGSVDVAAAEWTRACLAVTVRYPPEPTAMAGATVTDPELRATGPQPERIASPWGPFSVPAWIDVAGAEPAIAPGGDPAVVSVEVSGLGELPPGQPPWIVSFLSGTGALTAQTDVPVTPANPVAVLGAPAAGTRYAAQLVDPFGVPRPPVIL